MDYIPLERDGKCKELGGRIYLLKIKRLETDLWNFQMDRFILPFRL